MIEKIKPISDEIKKLMNDKQYLKDVMVEGATKANQVAKNTINDVYDIIPYYLLSDTQFLLNPYY